MILITQLTIMIIPMWLLNPKLNELMNNIPLRTSRKIPSLLLIENSTGHICSSLIPIGSYDLDKFNTPITIRYAKEGDKYNAIGGKERVMKGNEILTVGVNNAVLSQFPYRDADATKITSSTKNFVILSMGVEGVPKNAIKKGITLTLRYLTQGISGNVPRFLTNEIKYLKNFAN